MHQSCLLIIKEKFLLKNIRKYRFIMVCGYFIGDTYCKTSVVHEGRTIFKDGKEGGAVSFSAIIPFGARRFFPKSFLLQQS